MRKRFLVKATDGVGNIAWLTPAEARGFRCISVIADADIFATLEEAMAAIAKMPATFAKVGIQFSIESESPVPARHSGGRRS